MEITGDNLQEIINLKAGAAAALKAMEKGSRNIGPAETASMAVRAAEELSAGMTYQQALKILHTLPIGEVNDAFDEAKIEAGCSTLWEMTVFTAEWIIEKRMGPAMVRAVANLPGNSVKDA